MSEVKITGIHHVAIKCRGAEEFKKTIDLYRNVLGMPLTREWGEGSKSGAMLDTGAGIMEVFADSDGNADNGAIRHFAFSVEDVDACIEAVRKAGCKITTEPMDIAIPSNPPYPARIAFCTGFAGEEIEFFHAK